MIEPERPAAVTASEATRAGGRARILFCETNVDGTIGGSYYSLLYLVKGLDRTRYEPVVLFYTEHSLLGAFRDAGVETVVWPRRRRFTFGSRLPAGAGWLRAPVMALQKALNAIIGFVVPTLSGARFLWTRQIAIVHLNNSVLYNHDWMLAARLLGRRCVTHERGINLRYPAPARYWAARLDAVICISEAVRAQMIDAGVRARRFLTIHNGFDPAEVRRQVPPAELRTSLGIEPGADVVVMVGNLKVWKGQETVVRAIERVRRTRPAIRCVLVGATAPADRPFEEGLRQLVAALGLEPHVLFAGFRTNVADFLAMADVVVHASIEPEPFGRVLLEAMACARPVIGSRAGGVTEIIDEGRTGLMFDPGDADGLAACIERLLADRAAATRMGEAGYMRLLEHFPIARNVRATERLYDTLVGAR